MSLLALLKTGSTSSKWVLIDNISKFSCVDVPYRPTPNETVIDHTKGQGMGATVNFNISTVDAAGFDQLLASRKGLITSIINNAMNNQGKMGVV